MFIGQIASEDLCLTGFFAKEAFRLLIEHLPLEITKSYLKRF